MEPNLKVLSKSELESLIDQENGTFTYKCFDFIIKGESQISPTGMKIMIRELLDVEFYSYQLVDDKVLCHNSNRFTICESPIKIGEYNPIETFSYIFPLLAQRSKDWIRNTTDDLVQRFDNDNESISFLNYNININKFYQGVDKVIALKTITFPTNENMLFRSINKTTLSMDNGIIYIPSELCEDNISRHVFVKISNIHHLFNWLQCRHLMKLDKIIPIASKEDVNIKKIPTETVKNGIVHMKEEIERWNSEINKIDENNKQIQKTCDSLLEQLNKMAETVSDNELTANKYKKLISDYETILSFMT